MIQDFKGLTDFLCYRLKIKQAEQDAQGFILKRYR